MPRAVAVGLPEPAPQISASPRGYQSHFSHAGERIWPETNCYLDLWIETPHALGLDPAPAFACALSADHDGLHVPGSPAVLLSIIAHSVPRRRIRGRAAAPAPHLAVATIAMHCAQPIGGLC